LLAQQSNHEWTPETVEANIVKDMEFALRIGESVYKNRGDPRETARVSAQRIKVSDHRILVRRRSAVTDDCWCRPFVLRRPLHSRAPPPNYPRQRQNGRNNEGLTTVLSVLPAACRFLQSLAWEDQCPRPSRWWSNKGTTKGPSASSAQGAPVALLRAPTPNTLARTRTPSPAVSLIPKTTAESHLEKMAKCQM
jgi:hypothetical protein